MFRASTWTCLLRPDSSEPFSPSQTSSYWWHHSQSIASQIRAVGKKLVSLIGWNCYSLTYDTLGNNFWIKNDFTKYLKNCFKSSNLYLPFKYFPNYAFGWKILSKLSGDFWLLWAFKWVSIVSNWMDKNIICIMQVRNIRKRVFACRLLCLLIFKIKSLSLCNWWRKLESPGKTTAYIHVTFTFLALMRPSHEGSPLIECMKYVTCKAFFMYDYGADWRKM